MHKLTPRHATATLRNGLFTLSSSINFRGISVKYMMAPDSPTQKTAWIFVEILSTSSARRFFLASCRARTPAD